jgi:hypothetical protein
MQWTVKQVKPTNNYILLLTFESGEQRKFDMKPYLEVGVFRALKDPSMFETAHLSFDTVEWNNKADIDPEILYKHSEPV